MKNFCIIILLAISPAAFAQQVYDSIPKGKLVIKADLRIDTLIQKRIEKNKESGTMSGYRIQIFFGDQKKTAMDIKTDFLEKYPDIPAYIFWEAPNFKVRVGDYLSPIDAQPLYNKLMLEMENIFIVPTDINLPPLE